jgi:SAM-dependent methyltransferase
MPDETQQSHWDLKYERGLPSLTRPDPFFLTAFRQFVESRFSDGGVALDLAGGVGRHALWLAERKWRVNVVDISEVAICKLHQSAAQLGLTLDLLVLDAAEYRFQPAFFDLIVLFYHLNRNLCPRIVSALKPGGILICKNSLRWNSDGTAARSSTGPLERNEILSLFPDLHVLYYKERPVRDRGVVEFVGTKAKGTSGLKAKTSA